MSLFQDSLHIRTSIICMCYGPLMWLCQAVIGGMIVGFTICLFTHRTWSVINHGLKRLLHCHAQLHPSSLVQTFSNKMKDMLQFTFLFLLDFVPNMKRAGKITTFPAVLDGVDTNKTTAPSDMCRVRREEGRENNFGKNLKKPLGVTERNSPALKPGFDALIAVISRQLQHFFSSRGNSVISWLERCPL